MTDNTAIQNEHLWLPNDIWTTIASFLDNDDLAKFRQLCSTTQFIGSDAAILQPLYNRLYALDKTLTPLLPQKDTLVTLKQSFEKIQAQQQLEITYLKKHHPEKMAASEHVFQENVTASLKSLEAINAVLDKINCEIITSRIENGTRLNLERAGITRFPAALFQLEEYADFWPKVTHLYCSGNELTTLNVQRLTALELLWCDRNKLMVLNMQGLKAVQWLSCFENPLTALNLQGFSALQELHCHNNPLIDLNLTGVSARIKTLHGIRERELLFNQLGQADSLEARKAIIVRIGAKDYTHANCLKYCPDYAATLFASDLANSISQAPDFLPFFEAANTASENASLKRKRDEEESDNQSDLKKRKKK